MLQKLAFKLLGVRPSAENLLLLFEFFLFFLLLLLLLPGHLYPKDNSRLKLNWTLKLGTYLNLNLKTALEQWRHHDVIWCRITLNQSLIIKKIITPEVHNGFLQSIPHRKGLWKIIKCLTEMTPIWPCLPVQTGRWSQKCLKGHNLSCGVNMKQSLDMVLVYEMKCNSWPLKLLH